MGVDRLRVLALAIVALVLVVLSTWFLDWFTMDFQALIYQGRSFDTELSQIEYVGVSLSDVNACSKDGVCESQSFSSIGSKDWYTTFAAVTLWSALGLTLVLAIQVGLRMIADQAHPTLSKVGYSLGTLTFSAAFFTAFLFNPETGAHEGGNAAMGMFASISIERTWAPHLLMLGIVVGFFALHAAVHHDTQTTAIADMEPPVGLPQARALPPRPESQPIPMPTPPSVRKISTASIPRIDPAQAHLVGHLKYAMASAEITRGGIDARREDRTAVLVMWRDVVGVVARRMPASHDGIAFADVISTAGSTLRLVPWTRLSGDPVEGEGEARVRAFVQLVVERCPEVRVDRATREFLESGAPAQLADVEMLAVHDSKLA